MFLLQGGVCPCQAEAVSREYHVITRYIICENSQDVENSIRHHLEIIREIFQHSTPLIKDELHFQCYNMSNFIRSVGVDR